MLVLIVVIWIMTSGTMGITSRLRQAETRSKIRKMEDGCFKTRRSFEWLRSIDCEHNFWRSPEKATMSQTHEESETLNFGRTDRPLSS